eukprot:TRINITY_DN11262_c0_g1_i1.p1 TRINITY_DN11262_c0_g1~~TRINITY_DN11262_c0_g1_i1.p1  ORF type:complete len:191 (+),score=9.07 TRINITY_DN11262_c0_g1_i1:67-573(+)
MVHEADCAQTTVRVAAIGAGLGLFASACGAPWAVGPVEPTTYRALFKDIGSQGLLFGVMAGAYVGGKCFAESIRNKEDAWNGVYAAVAAGFVNSIRTQRVGPGAAAAAGLSVFSVVSDLWTAHVRDVESRRPHKPNRGMVAEPIMPTFLGSKYTFGYSRIGNPEPTEH